jgi:predicted dehydrogenase
VGQESIGIGVVGCGFFGRQLARALARTPNARVIAVTDVVEASAEALAAELGCAVDADVSVLASRAEVDVVVVATPNHTHVEPALVAIHAGKGLFVEKPMALSSAGCETLLAAARQAGDRLLVGHIIRLLPAVAEMRRAIDAGEIGTPIMARATRCRWANSTGAPANWWKFDQKRSGGELLHEIHELDLLCWLLGDVESVYTQAANLAHPELGENEDVIQLSLRFATGALATLELGTAYQAPQWGCLIGGTEGALALDLRGATLTTFRSGGPIRTRGVFDDERANESLRAAAQVSGRAYNTVSTQPPFWMEHAADLEARNIVEHFGGGASSVLAEDRARAVGVAEAALESAAQRAPVSVPGRYAGTVSA